MRSRNLQRIERDLGQLDLGQAAVVEQRCEPVLGPDAHVMAAVRADPQVGLEVAMEDHLLAGGHLSQRFSGTSACADERADLGPDVIGQPVHAAALARAAHARAASAPNQLEHGLDQAAAWRAAGIERRRDPVDQRRADHRRVGDARRSAARLLGRPDAEADGDRQVGVAPSAPRRGAHLLAPARAGR